MAVPEPKITVSISDYYRELRYFRTLRDRLRKLYSEWGRLASLWRWRRRPEDYEKLVATIRSIMAVRREEREARAVFRRKVKMPYWRVGVAYMFRKEVKQPPYLFYAEFRKTVYTRNPEKYAEMDPRTMEWTKPKPWLEEELREIMFASSVLARRTKTGAVAHGEWLDAMLPLKVLPFPDFECSAIDEREVEAPLDTETYYVRIQKGEKEVYEYGTAEVEGWLKAYRRWVRTMAEERARAGIVRYPERYAEAYIRNVRQRTLEEFVEFWESVKGRKEGGEK